MKKATSILAVVALMISTNLFAQRTSDVGNSKDYPSVTRFEGSFIEYYKVTKSDDYKIPLNFAKGNLDFVNPADVEGKIIRIQYSAKPDNNTAYVMKTLKTSIVKDGFKLLYAKSDKEIPLNLSSALYKDLNNQKFGFRYETKGKDQGLIIAKKQDKGKEIYACIYISGFDNVTLITQDVIETEPYNQKSISPLISDFTGAVKYYQKITKWDTYIFPTEKMGWQGWKKTIKAQGEITRTQYVTSKDNNPAFVYMNYTEALKKSNWTILFGGSGTGQLNNDSYEWQYYLFQEGYKQGSKFGDRLGFRANDRAKYAYIAAEYEDTDNLYYAVIYIIDKGWGTMINQDIIKTKKPDVGLVTAKILTEKMDKNGHFALGGIFFETGKSTLTAQSDAALKTIADYLNAHKDKKYFIVGHTDNVGEFEANKKLSENRANAVLNELTTKYGVNSEQLKAYGIANLSPVVSNSTDKGKSRNRRVEIVEQ
ncbi:MAG: OmpA family protein [Chlorobi bacterium]|nr:OmpA family protein [Chlorobiota bacterium]